MDYLSQRVRKQLYFSGLLLDSLSIPCSPYNDPKRGPLGLNHVSSLCSNTKTEYDVSCLANARLPQTSGCVAVRNTASSPHNY